MSKNLTNKPLKGTSISGNIGTFDTLTATNLILPSSTVESLINGSQFDNVIIINSEISNSIIGANGSNEATFTSLTTEGDVIFYSVDHSKNTNWDSINGTLTVTGALTVTGCSLLGNIDICQNTIQAINANGDINIIPKGIGSIYLTGPISNVSSIGNYLTSLANGNIQLTSSDFINITSQKSSINNSSFLNNIISTVNGDIKLNTDTGLGIKLISLIDATGGNVRITTVQNSNVKIGDNLTLSNTNSIPNLNGVYTVTSIINTNSFLISTGNTFSGITNNGSVGNMYKPPNNNINLNASLAVNIPRDIPLNFGNTNNIIGNTSGLLITSNNNVVINVPINNVVEIPQNINFQFGTFGNNNMNFDGTSVNINSFNNININSSNISNGSTYINSEFTLIKDPNPMISNYQQINTDISDKGLQFQYWSGGSNGSMKLGWFGYKQINSQFTFLTNCVNNNDVFSGSLGKFTIGDITVNNITLNSGGTLDMQCGKILNINTITGCGGTVNINSSNNVNIITGTRLSLLSSGDIYIPTSIPLILGNSNIKESSGNLILASQNISFTTTTNGSIIIPVNTKLIYNGTSNGNVNSVADTSGNFSLSVAKNIFVNITNGNFILPTSITNTSGAIQFGNLTESIYASTTGLFITSNSSFGNINLLTTNAINIQNTIGNVNLNALYGDINLFSTNGNIRLYQNSRIILGVSGTVNSIYTSTTGNFILDANTINNIDLRNVSNINLLATTAINIPTNTKINLDTLGSRYIVTDTISNLYINNITTIGNVQINSYNTIISNVNTTSINSVNTNINNTNTNIISVNTNISSSTFIISGNLALFNNNNVKFIDPILTLGNYTVIDNKDRGIEYSNYSSTKLGWFGYKNSTGQFSFYSDAINTNEVISGTLGQFALGSAIITDSIKFLNTGTIDMNCGSINNLNTITGCHGTFNINASSNINISSNNLILNTSNVQIPYNTTLSFGNTTNTISSDSNGNMTITTLNGSGTLILNSNVQINGTTENVYSTITNYQDPIISLGGVTNPITNDLKDRGIEFKWNNGTNGNVGFFGFKNSTQRFVFYPVETNTNEVITGVLGDVQFRNGFFNNLDTQCGTIANVAVITACTNQSLYISSGNVLLSSTAKLNFGNTSNYIGSDSIGNLILNNSNTSGIFISDAFTQFKQNSPINLNSTSSSINLDTNSNLIITNSIGNILLNSLNTIIPINSNLNFGTTGSKIILNNTNLQIYGNTVSVNTTSGMNINGNVNVYGTLNYVDSGKYIYPLGTNQLNYISSITNSTTIGNAIITLNTQSYLSIGDTVTLNYTDCVPSLNGIYTVVQINSPTAFSINSSNLTINATKGVMNSILKTSQNKSIGIEVDIWNNTTGNGITSGSAYYQTGFFGVPSISGTNSNFAYYSSAVIQNNLVVSGTLGNIQTNELITSKISGFTLDGSVVGGSFIIAGSNFQISGGLIDNTIIGQTTPVSGRFTTLSSTVSASLQNVTLTSNLNYSIERYTLSSLIQTRNPSVSTNISYITISGVNFTGASGTMGNSSVVDGQMKKIIISSLGTGCTYTLTFPTGTLIAPNPLGGVTPQKLIFKFTGQSCDMTWNSSLTGWQLIGGSGVYVS